MEQMLTLLVAALMVPGGAESVQNPIVFGEIFECGSSRESMQLWLFVEEDQDARCETISPGRFQCYNGSGSRAYGSCEIGCVETAGYSGCLAMSRIQLAEFRDRLPREPLFSVVGRKPDGRIEENCVLIPAREDSHCWIKTLGRSVVGGECGGVGNGQQGAKTWAPMAEVEVFGSRCNCGELEIDEKKQRGCAIWPLLLQE